MSVYSIKKTLIERKIGIYQNKESSDITTHNLSLNSTLSFG